MKYKLLLVDLDDTLYPDLGMPPKEFAPSLRFVKAFQKANKYIAISLCTGRDKKTVLKVVKKLRLTVPQIIEGGAKIINSKGKELWVRYINERSAIKIIGILEKTKTSFAVVVGGIEIVDTIPSEKLDKITAVLFFNLNQKQIRELKNELFDCKDIAITLNRDRMLNTAYITHRKGTKACGIKKLMAMLDVKKKEIIGVGDGNNDKELLLMSDLKVAMGNAVKEIKEIADYIAPSVHDDGIIDVIEKFVLA